MHKRERYFVNAYGPDDKAFAALIKKALEIEKRLGNVDRIVFVAHGLQNDGWLERQFGRDGVKKLKKGVKVQGSDVPSFFESLKTYETNGNEILITMGLQSDDILLLDDNFGVSALLALPWRTDDAEKWSKITDAINIQDNIPATAYPSPPCVVTRALYDLTHSINMSTGLGHPSDDDLAKTYLRALFKYNYPLNELEIESYLIKELNWFKEHSDELLTIIQKINQGRSFQGGDKTHLKYHVDRWKNECEE